MEIDKSLKEIGNFRGTEQYHNIMGADVTDGVVYVMNNGYGWVITDALVICKMKLKDHPFIAIELKQKDGKAKIVYTDGNGKELYKQEYEYTDATQDLSLYFIDGVMLLTGEY